MNKKSPEDLGDLMLEASDVLKIIFKPSSGARDNLAIFGDFDDVSPAEFFGITGVRTDCCSN